MVLEKLSIASELLPVILGAIFISKLPEQLKRFWKISIVLFLADFGLAISALNGIKSTIPLNLIVLIIFLLFFNFLSTWPKSKLSTLPMLYKALFVISIILIKSYLGWGNYNESFFLLTDGVILFLSLFLLLEKAITNDLILPIYHYSEFWIFSGLIILFSSSAISLAVFTLNFDQNNFLTFVQSYLRSSANILANIVFVFAFFKNPSTLQ